MGRTLGGSIRLSPKRTRLTYYQTGNTPRHFQDRATNHGAVSKIETGLVVSATGCTGPSGKLVEYSYVKTLMELWKVVGRDAALGVKGVVKLGSVGQRAAKDVVFF